MILAQDSCLHEILRENQTVFAERHHERRTKSEANGDVPQKDGRHAIHARMKSRG